MTCLEQINYVLHPVRGDSVVQNEKVQKSYISTTLRENWIVADERATRQFQGVLKNMSLLVFFFLKNG